MFFFVLFFSFFHFFILSFFLGMANNHNPRKQETTATRKMPEGRGNLTTRKTGKDQTAQEGPALTPRGKGWPKPFWLKVIAHVCFADCSGVCSFFCIFVSRTSHGSQRMVARASSFRLVVGDPWPSSTVEAVAFSEGERSNRRTAGSSRVLETVPGRWDVSGAETQDEPRCRPRDGLIFSYEIRESIGCVGRRARPCRGCLQGRIDESQESLQATCGGRGNRPVSRVHCQVREADQGVGFTTCRGVCPQDTGLGVSRDS